MEVVVVGDEQYWESDWLDYILKGTNIPFKYVKSVENSPVIIISSFFRNYNSYIATCRQKNLRYGLVILSDEGLNTSVPERDDPLCMFVARNYVHPDTVAHSKVFTFPLGFKFGYVSEDVPCLPVEKRAYVWSFAGSVHHDERAYMVNLFKRVTPNFYYKCSAFNSGDALNTQKYRAVLDNSKFAPCPYGHINNDTFRICEALESGCIPVVLKHAPHLPADPSYWHFLFDSEEDIPFIITDTWDEAYDRMLTLLQNPKRLTAVQNSCIEFWKKWKKIVISRFQSRMQMLV